MTLLRTEWVSLYDRYKKLQYREITRQLDEPTIRIFSAMWKYGPRNLLEVARQTGIPFTSVYHRIARIETNSQEVAALVPPGSKLGLVRIVTLASAAPGSEDKVTTALKAPNLWRSVARCEGNFTHISVQLVPAKYLKEYRSYIQQLVDVGLVKTFSIIYTGDYVPNFPDFDYYDPRETRWKFDWEAWLASLDKNSGFTTDDPQSYQIHTDKKDLMIIWQLEMNARSSFADMAKTVGMTPQGVKYHYEKLFALGIVKPIQFRVHPYPMEVAAYHEVMLEFNSKEDLDRFCSIVPRLFFVLGLAKLLRKNAVMVQTWMLESQLPKMFSFFSELARKGLLRSYSAVRIDFASKQGQTISEDLFDDEKGWVVDFAKCSYELQRIEKAEIST
jgi:DNA-binding Lrp family transcriptional regulator